MLTTYRMMQISSICSCLAVVGLMQVRMASGQVVQKRCDRCQKAVPISSKVGDFCPHCHVQWGVENKEFINVPHSAPTKIQPSDPGYEGSQYPESTDAVTPKSDYQYWLYMQYLERQARLDQLRQRRNAIDAQRQQTYANMREKAEQLRVNENPDQRAERHLLSAIRCENRGDVQSAVAFYALAAKLAQGTTVSAQAIDALQRLNFNDWHLVELTNPN